MKFHLKLSSVKWWPFCHSIGVLNMSSLTKIECVSCLGIKEKPKFKYKMSLVFISVKFHSIFSVQTWYNAHRELYNILQCIHTNNISALITFHSSWIFMLTQLIYIHSWIYIHLMLIRPLETCNVWMNVLHLWLRARLWYLLCSSTGDTTVLH